MINLKKFECKLKVKNNCFSQKKHVCLLEKYCIKIYDTIYNRYTNIEQKYKKAFSIICNINKLIVYK